VSAHPARDLAMLGRVATRLPAFVRSRITVDDAREILRRRLEQRESSFLELVERGVYPHPASPYRALLREARCEPGDLRSMVRARGLEETLAALRDAGVYVSFEEFKGRQPIVRNGRVIDAGPQAFRNPLVTPHFASRSTGSTGTPTEITSNLQRIYDTTPYHLLSDEVHVRHDAPIVLWRCRPPLGSGLTHVLRGILTGNQARVWFEPMGSDEVRVEARHRLTTRFVLAECRLLGHRVPSPQPVPFSRAVVVARAAAALAAAEGDCIVRAGVSMSLRVALAAIEDGIGLDGVTFIAGGEPPTPAKVAGIQRSGARFVPSYSASDIGCVGMGCGDPADETDVHFLEDGLAAIQVPVPIAATGEEIDAFCFTTLRSSSSRLLLNVEMDDFGILERRECGCPFGELGFDAHIRRVRSYRKLTGEGINLLDGEMMRILEEILPARFGGAPHDYQLHEREDEDGFTRLVLVVDPRIEIPGEGDLVALVLETLRDGNVYADSAREHWRQAGSFRVERRAPEWTGRGKFPPLVVHRV
jgi:hypothetical protein